MQRWAIAFLTVLTIGLASTAVFAESSKLKRPPDVDLDPERGMTFGRIPKTSFDGRMYGPLKQGLRSRTMDSTIDPYNSVLQTDRYEPHTGKIRNSLTDTVRSMRRNEELRRTNNDEDRRNPSKAISNLNKKDKDD
jgi:hypothetical protein